MKTCAICGQAAERGSMCRDCRAALKRARDETVSQFQPKPALAMAGEHVRHDRAVAAPPAVPAGQAALTPPVADRQHRHHDHEKRPVTRREFPTRGPRPAPAPEAMPGRSGASRFVWVIVTLMVLVVSYVAYGVISAGIEGARNAAPAPATKEPAAVRPPPAPAPRRVETMVTPSLRETQLGYGVQEEVERRMGAPVASEIATVTPQEKPREAARHGGADPTAARPVARAAPGPVRSRGRAAGDGPGIREARHGRGGPAAGTARRTAARSMGTHGGGTEELRDRGFPRAGDLRAESASRVLRGSVGPGGAMPRCSGQRPRAVSRASRVARRRSAQARVAAGTTPGLRARWPSLAGRPPLLRAVAGCERPATCAHCRCQFGHDRPDKADFRAVGRPSVVKTARRPSVLMTTRRPNRARRRASWSPSRS